MPRQKAERTKSEIDHEVAVSLNIHPRIVADVTNAFLDEVSNSLVKYRVVSLHKFGKISLHIVKVNSKESLGYARAPNNFRVHFIKSKTLKDKAEQYYGGREWDGEAGSSGAGE
jgi:nucleoid DNA-binding protein